MRRCRRQGRGRHWCRHPAGQRGAVGHRRARQGHVRRGRRRARLCHRRDRGGRRRSGHPVPGVQRGRERLPDRRAEGCRATATWPRSSSTWFSATRASRSSLEAGFAPAAGSHERDHADSGRSTCRGGSTCRPPRGGVRAAAAGRGRGAGSTGPASSTWSPPRTPRRRSGSACVPRSASTLGLHRARRTDGAGAGADGLPAASACSAPWCCSPSCCRRSSAASRCSTRSAAAACSASRWTRSASRSPSRRSRW